jgi:hypothetical protein
MTDSSDLYNLSLYFEPLSTETCVETPDTANRESHRHQAGTTTAAATQETIVLLLINRFAFDLYCEFQLW